MIRFENVAKEYQDGTRAVDDLNLSIKEGEFFVFIGPSGCGKTTTLKMINRLINLTDGTLYIDEKKISEYDINELRWNIGYVLQQIALFPHMTIEENISVVPELRGWNQKRIRERVTELLEMVGLDPDTYRNRKPSELSGGQKQRVGVLRALAADPDIILMDEPFSALDPISREKLQKDIVQLQQRIKKTIVFVTHDMKEALALGDRICLMREGGVVQVDTPQAILQNPADEFVEEFVGRGAGVSQQKLIEDDTSVSDLLEKTNEETSIIDATNAVSYQTRVKDVLARLSDEDEIPVEKDGHIIGVISNRSIVRYVNLRMEQGGARQ